METLEASDPRARPSAILPQINIVEYSVEDFAKSLKKFYDALVEEGVSVPFAERLTVAFCQRP